MTAFIVGSVLGVLLLLIVFASIGFADRVHRRATEKKTAEEPVEKKAPEEPEKRVNRRRRRSPSESRNPSSISLEAAMARNIELRFGEAYMQGAHVREWAERNRTDPTALEADSRANIAESCRLMAADYLNAGQTEEAINCAEVAELNERAAKALRDGSLRLVDLDKWLIEQARRGR